MRHYETTYILRSNLGEDQCTEIIDRASAIVDNDGGAIICLERWGVRRLAYEINREAQGYYVYMNYAAPGRAVDEIERIFRIDDRVLRYLTVKLGDTMTAETIEAEKQHIAEKAAARAKAEAENSEDDDFDDESMEEESSEE
jgi:ribosomal protein S6